MYVVSRKHGILLIRLNVAEECSQRTYKIIIFSIDRKSLLWITKNDFFKSVALWNKLSTSYVYFRRLYSGYMSTYRQNNVPILE